MHMWGVMRNACMGGARAMRVWGSCAMCMGGACACVWGGAHAMCACGGACAMCVWGVTCNACAWGVHAQCTRGGSCAMHMWGCTWNADVGVHVQCVHGGCIFWPVIHAMCIIVCPWLRMVGVTCNAYHVGGLLLTPSNHVGDNREFWGLKHILNCYIY